MKHISVIGLLFIYCLNFAQSDGYAKNPAGYVDVNNTAFNPGEEIYFKATFGWFTVGNAEIQVSSKLYNVNDRTCYKVDVYGKTSGIVDWLARVDDQWGAYLDKEAMVTQKAYRYIKEGNYRKNEITYFDHIKDSIAVKTYSRKFGRWKEPEVFYSEKENIRDMIGGFFYLRTIDYSGMKKGDIIEVNGFYEDTFYDLKVVYKGKERIKTKVGIINTIKLVPIMPKNSLFDGKDSIKTWISDDENKIPVKVEAKMFLGDAGVELTGTKNLRHPLNVYKK